MVKLLIDDKLREDSIMMEYDKVTGFYLVISIASFVITLIGAVVL